MENFIFIVYNQQFKVDNRGWEIKYFFPESNRFLRWKISLAHKISSPNLQGRIFGIYHPNFMKIALEAVWTLNRTQLKNLVPDTKIHPYMEG
jgi:hypothetical protein